MPEAATTHVRVSRPLNERMKSFAEIYGLSTAEFTERALEAVCGMLDGDERVPLLVAEYRLKKEYAAGQGSPMPGAKAPKRARPTTAK